MDYDEILHEGFQQCTSCKEWFCTLIRDRNGIDEKKCLMCYARIDLDEYFVIIKELGKLQSYILSTPAKELDLEVVKSMDFINKKVKADLIKYLENN